MFINGWFKAKVSWIMLELTEGKKMDKSSVELVLPFTVVRTILESGEERT